MSDFGDMFSALDKQSGNALAPPAAAPAPKASGMQSMFDALDNDPKIRATNNLVAAQSVAPNHAAEALQASRATGIPQPAAEENLADAKQSAQLKANVDTLDQNPNLANFVADNPLAARLAQDDFQKLGTLEQLTTALKTGVSGALMGNELGRQGSLKQAAGLVGADTPAVDQKITGLQGAMAAQPKLTGGMGFVQNFTGFLTGLVDNAIQGGSEGGLAGAGIGAGLGAAVGGVGALPGAAAGGTVGAVAGFNVDMARVAAGNAYLKMGQIRGADGQPLSEGGKQFGAIFTGAATYALGTYASKIESKLLGETADSLAQQAIAKAVQTPTFTQAVKSFAGDTFKGAAQGAGIMTAMEASGIIGEEIAKAASSGHFETNPQEIVDRLADAAINGAVLLGAMHGSMHGLSLYGDIRNAQRAESQAAMFKNIMDGSLDAKLRERDLQGFQQFMQNQTDGSPVENIYLPADKVRELYQGSRIDPGAMTADPFFSFVPDMAKQLQEAGASGGDVVIPTADFVTHLAGTPLAERLMPDLRVGADAMSVNEAKAFTEEYQARIKEAVDQAGKATELDSSQKIADEVRKQAVAAGYPDALASRYGAIYAARYSARAERRGLGEDPFELFQNEAPKIQAGVDGARASYNQDGVGDLLVQHNLTADNLLHAKKMGGIPVPSLAITKGAHPLTSFGDITLLGDKGLIDPRGYAKTRVFGADIYSPRYPRVQYELPPAKLRTLRSTFTKGEEATGAKIDESELKNRGPEELKNSAAVMWQFLTEKGIKPNVKVKDGFSKERLARLKKFGFEKYFGNTDHQSLMRSEEFQKLVIAEQNEAHTAGGLDDLVVDFDHTKENDYSRLMALSRNPAYEMGKVGKDAEPDGYATRDALREQIRGKLDGEFKKYVEKKFEDAGAKEKIFKGFNNNGDRKYTPHTLDSVVKILKAELRGGEGFNYGVGSLRAKFTPEFKSIEQIRKNKDRLMDHESFEAVKKEVDDELSGISDDLKLSLDQTIEVLEDAPKMGVTRAIDRAFTDYRKGADASDAVKERIAKYLTRLKNLPTEYFEAKILREVDPTEFKGAVVPHDIDPEALQYLKDRGIADIRTYQRGDEGDRAKQIGGFSHLFFQNKGDESAPRGSILFSDGPAVINLFAKADPSTLIHESGHAWLEELVADGTSEEAPQQLKDDLATVRAWLGNDGGELTVDQHEQFARAAEAYLMEGKAPSVALARVFTRFKQWLTKLYTTVKALDTPINDDIRQVFDRLLATDAEIEEAKRSTGLEPNFKSREDAGMTTAEWNAYTSAIDKANQQAESTLLDKMMAKIRRQRTAEYKEERAKAVEAATTEVDARPDIQALTMLRSIKADAEKVKLSSADIEGVYGKDGVSAMPKGTLAKDGVHPDYVAEMLGFNSGDELVKALQALEKQQREIQAEEGEKRGIRKYLIDQAADQKMEPHAGDMLDEQSIREEAQAAVHSESRAALLAQELRYLKRSAARALEERGKGRKAVDQVKTEADWNAAEADLMAKLDKAQAVASAEEKTGKASDKAQATIADLKQQIADLKMTDRWNAAEADLMAKMEKGRQDTERQNLLQSVLVSKAMLEGIAKQVDSILENKTTEEVGRFGMYLRDERRAAREVQQAILKKDWAAAAVAKQRQLLSHILYVHAKAASDVIDRGTANMKRLTDKKSIKSMDQEYTDQIQDLLRRFGFDSGRGDELQRALKGSLEDFVKSKAEEAGIELAVDPALYTMSKDVGRLTYAEFKALDEAVRSMQEIGRGMKMIEVDGVQRDIDEVKAEIVAAIRELGERMKSDFYDPRDAGKLAAAKEKVFGIFRGIDASLTKPEALFDQIDKGDAFGIMNRAIFRRLKEAQAHEDAWHEVASKEMTEAVKAAGKDWAKHLDDVVPDEPGLTNPETGRPMKLTRKRMISMALNWGNEGNRIKLAEGHKWHPGTIQQFLNKNMAKADWDFVQRVWGMFDSHKQDLDDLQRRVTGVGLDMVQADAFDTPHGRYAGGYYPIVYDAGKSYQAEAHSEKATEALFPSNYTRATTPKGSTISRVEGVKRPIQLSLDVAPWKIGQVIHDLAFRESIIDADRLLSADSVKKAMDDVFGPEYRKMMRPWLKHIANSKNIDDAAIGWMDKAISTARTNTVIVGIGFRLSTMFKHGFSALSNSFKEVGPEWMLKGTREFYAPGRLKENWEFITSKSAEMKYRMNAYDKDVTSKYNELLNDSTYTTFQKQAQHFGHLGVSYLDLGSAAPTWLGAYRKALAQGMEDKDAVYMADKTVRNAHGAQGITDTAQIQRTTGVANLVNMFYGFFNHIYNRQRTMFIQGAEGVRNTKAGEYKAATKNFADVLATSFWYLAVPALVEAMATNGGPSEQKDEGWGEWAGKAILAEIPAGIPVIRDIAKAAIEGRDYEVSPVAKAVSDVLHAGRDISSMVQGTDPDATMGKHIATALGYIAGLPTAAPFTAGKFLWDINSGDADPQSIKDWYQGLTRGKVTQE